MNVRTFAPLASVIAVLCAPGIASADRDPLPDLASTGPSAQVAPPAEPAPPPAAADAPSAPGLAPSAGSWAASADDEGPAPALPSPPAPTPRSARPALRYAAPQPEAPPPRFSPQLPIDAPAPPTAPRKYDQRYLGFEVGARGTILADAGLDPYAENDLLGSLSVGATWEPMRVKPFYFGLAAEYDYGSRQARARGVPSALVVHRAAVGVRARWEAASWLSVYAKVSPGVLALRGSITDPALDRPLVARPITWTADVVGGLAFPIVTVGDREWPFARMWILVEGGYAFAGSATMTYSPIEDPNDARQFGSVNLPPLRASGVVSRLAIAMSF